MQYDIICVYACYVHYEACMTLLAVDAMLITTSAFNMPSNCMCMILAKPDA